MLGKTTHRKYVVAITFAGLVSGMMLYGCRSDQAPATAPSVTPSASSSDPAGEKFALWGPPPKKSGVQLWSETCTRCHNGRPPGEFSDAQWATIVHHMRLRANLTGDEAREIVQFLQASN
jgi:hypothetical protein